MYKLIRREFIARESRASTEREGEWGRDFTARSLTWVSETQDICQALTEETQKNVQGQQARREEQIRFCPLDVI